MKILLSAYCCEPGEGSEEGVGWNMANGLARHHDVWVITRANNRPVIEAALRKRPVPSLHFLYYDLPEWARWWKSGRRGLELYYYLWQLGIYGVARRAHQRIGFDVAHHVTLVRYWRPSLLSHLGIPFVWGPVGGGESAPAALRKGVGSFGRAYEHARDAARRIGEMDPFVKRTARRSTLALATTRETSARLQRLGAPRVQLLHESALNMNELAQLRTDETVDASPIRFVSIGRHIHWKGYHLSIRAFARAGFDDAEYWLIGDGIEHERLRALVAALGMQDKIHLTGQLPRESALAHLKQSHVFVHPSLHDSGGWACPEAMAAGRPVICLELGGPSTQVTSETGIKVVPGTSEVTIERLRDAMRRLASDEQLRVQMGRAGRRRAESTFSWSKRIDTIGDLYAEILNESPLRVHADAA